ncbi:MAG: UDP-N-acetylglucosamine 4,6-dehydratase (inverting) [Candidatus Chisholmbacteria bacterium RIFCSPHIGHO2_01_FULL_48_12]|uniref:UDP-N-acetylglucosamine 4,6-dehydratase (Inverting) n=1 Tax=Candidatus Chisholmbacteria bacterium RIFCSPHIGHO2_01_FULL_48_12 TaxID=1797589 RepID=A0A1G1VNQ0_9BACT|nr:MAG: UDP-N-acetylglucosamine 4,6-dehydratase (inverting) [Candidatus Chisholmbacteria bacterium RIFCSPHIGHO2_01_FULL_48_12]
MAKFSWQGKTVLITGGTGSFGRAFVNYLLAKPRPPVIRIFSRDEFKQSQMQQELSARRIDQVRFLLGDVRDKDRLLRATQGVDVVVHAAALKHIHLGEYNPFEPIKTNILGTQNVVEAVLDTGVKKAVLISSDKAVYPINLYGATKLCAEKLFVQGNVYTGKSRGVFSVVRYGNVLGSRGSVVPIFKHQKDTGVVTITDPKMTRFWITLGQACKFVEKAVTNMQGGEIFIPKIPSINIVDLAKVIAPGAKLKSVGIRPGEKLYEALITEEESLRLKEYKDYYTVTPQFPFWEGEQVKKRGRLKKPFIYRSDKNDQWLTRQQLRQLL